MASNVLAYYYVEGRISVKSRSKARAQASDGEPGDTTRCRRQFTEGGAGSNLDSQVLAKL
jgi:hypothetical protein